MLIVCDAALCFEVDELRDCSADEDADRDFSAADELSLLSAAGVALLATLVRS